jgi:hypothetical protein
MALGAERFMVSLSNHEASHRRLCGCLHGSSLDKLGMKKRTMKACFDQSTLRAAGIT